MQTVGIARGGNVKATSAAYGIPVSHLRRAIKNNLLRAYCTGGRHVILLWSEVDDYVRAHPAPTRTRRARSTQDGEACRGLTP
jgi:hypothetical protein